MGFLSSRVSPGLVKAALLSLAFVVAGSAWASSSGPLNPFPITGAYSALHKEDRDHISIIELSGNYDKLLSSGDYNVEPRAVVAREFLRAHPDNYDFIVVFSTFEFDTGDALAFHWGVQNQVQGINLPSYDISSLFGSAGRLKGFIDMAALTRYETNLLKSDFEFTLSVLAHEVLHQWGPKVRFMQPDNTLSDALIGREDAHWSYLFDSDASVEYGADWKDNGDGTFTSVGVERFFSPLDLYLMGYYKPEEVPPFYLIENSAIDKRQLPQENVTVSGTKRQITIDDIVAAEGPRVPSADEAQHDYRFAFILLTGQNETVTDKQILALNNIRKEFMTRYAILTGGRGVAQVFPEALPTESAGTPDEVAGGPIRTTTALLEDGLIWLRGQQQNDGSWRDKEATRFRDTTMALDTLSAIDVAFTGELNALTWLEGAAGYPNVDYLARYASMRYRLGLSSDAQLMQLMARQNGDGGWGLGDGYGSTALDTALVLRALASSGGAYAGAIDQAVGFLAARQNPDGGWSGADGGPSRTGVTVTVLQALKAAQQESRVDMALSLAWVAGKQNADGGFGDSPSTVHDTANVLNALISLEATDQIRAADAADYLMTTQSDEGSWAGSTYATALTVATLKRFNFPNWAVDPVILATPEVPRDGDRVEVRVTVRNNSNLATPAGTLRLYEGDPDAGGVQIGADMVLPLLAPNGGVELSRLWDTYGKAGAQTLVAVVDPDDAQLEMSERDNRVTRNITVAPAPAGVDLAVVATDISVSPAQPDTLPSNLSLSASVRNTGTTDASNVVVQIWDGNPGQGQLVGEDTLNILGRSSVVVNHTYALTSPGTTTFHVVLDPANQLLEEDESNNTATASISTLPTIDLAVSAGDISVSDNPAYVGDDITFTVQIHNRGTLDAPSATALFQISDGSTTREIQTTSVQVNAGQTVTQNVSWRVDMEGSLVFSALLDTDGLVPEVDEGNNSAVASLSAGLASGPNLAVDHRTFTFTPSPALEGQDLQLSAEVSNTGADPASNIEVAFYHGDPQQGGTQIDTTQVIATLNSGDSTTVSVLWPQLADSLDKLLFVVVDPQDQITEFYEGDNSAFNTVAVESLPDLATSTGDLVVAPAFPKVGESVTLTVRVSNLGQQAADNVVVRAFDGDPANGGVPIGSDQTILSLPGYGADTVQFGWTLSSAGAARPVVVQVDPAGAILERVTSNNSASRQIAVQDGDFYVTEPFISPNGDGVKELTRFFFRLQNPANVSVAVVNAKEETVRDLTSVEFQNTTGGNVLWDGLDALGRLVEDGRYRLRVADENGVLLGQAYVSVDTNHSPILDSIDTPYQSFSNLTCDISNATLLKVTEDENSIIFYTSDAPAGIYRMASNGTDVRAIVTRDSLGGDLIYESHASDDGETIVFRRDNTNNVQDLYVIAGSNGVPYTVALPGTGQINVLGISPDGSMAYTYRSDGLYAVPTDGVAQPTLLYALQNQWLSDFRQSNDGRYVSAQFYNAGVLVVDTQANSSVVIDNPNTGYSTYAWSPDGQRISIANPEFWRMDVYSPQGALLQSIDLPWAMDSLFEVDINEPQWSLSGTQFSATINFWNSCDASDYGEKAGGIVVFDTATNSSRIVASLEPTGWGCDSYHISTWDGANWVERGELHYDLHYSNQTLPLREYLPDPDGEYKVRIRQTGLEAAHVDRVALEADRMLLQAISATDTSSGDDLLPQVAYLDNEVQDLHEAEMEVHWNDVPPVAVSLSLLAREEQLSSRNAVPFSYPERQSAHYSYTVDGGGSFNIDGEVTAEDRRGAPLFDVFSKPGTGHPPAHVYGYLSSDDSYLYGALDFTVDNTIDGDKDWASLWVRSASGWREFRVTASDIQWGVAGFTRTERVNYRHKYYEFKIPLNELGASVGDTLDVRYQAYGTAAILIGENNDYLPHTGDLLWAPGDESLVYETYNQGNWAIRLDEGNRVQQLFAEWSSRPRNMRFVPSGRQLLFDSGEAGSDPNSVCYGNGWDDSWSFKSLLNLTADLRAIRSSQGGGLKLSGTAADMNFDSYALEYASVDTPDTWQPIAPASGQAQVDDQFTTWVPPGPGAYFVRLTVNDLAGNQRRFITRVYWSDSPSITDLYRSPRYISPNGDGTQDEAVIHYRVLQPVHLEFNIYNAKGELVRTIKRDHSLTGAEFDLQWDGRDGNGLLVADGDYRLVIQNYEFAITVDTAPPSLRLVKNNAYQSIYDELNDIHGVASRPSITWSIAEEHLADAALEKSDDFSTATWTESVDLSVYLNVSEQGDEFGVSLGELADKEYRLQAGDLAGNRTVVYANAADEEVFIEQFGNHAINPRMAECINELNPSETALDAGRRACVVSIGGYYKPLRVVRYVPLGDDTGGDRSSAIVSQGDIRFLVKESTQSRIVQAFIQYRLDGESTWSEEPALGYVDLPQSGFASIPAGDLNEPKDDVAHVIWRPMGLNSGNLFVVRVRVVDALGNEHLSNAFRFLTRGLSFNGMLPPPWDPVFKSKIEPLLPEDMDPFNEWYLWGEQFIGSRVATVDLYIASTQDPRYAAPRRVASVSQPGETFIFRTKELEACKEYTGTIVAKGAKKLDGTADEVGRTAGATFTTPCLEMDVAVETAFAEACGDPSPDSLSVKMKPVRRAEGFTTGGSELKLLTLFSYDEAGQEDVVFNVNKPESGKDYFYEIDTSGLAEAKLQYYAKLINEADDELTLPVEVVIDHTPPTLDITYPIEGQKVCGVPVLNAQGETVTTVLLEGSGFDANNFHYEVDIDSQLIHKSRDGGLKRPYDSYNLGAPANPQPDPHPEFHLGPNEAGQIALVADRHGNVEARYRVFDHGGFQQCATRVFEIDGIAELYAMTLSRSIISPNADAIADSLDVGYTVGEAGFVDINVYKAAYDSHGRLLKLGDPVRNLLSASPVLPGSSSLAWDGMDDGGVVVPDGMYAVEVVMRDGCNLVKSLMKAVDVDLTPPELAVAFPQTGDPLAMLIEVIGTARDDHFQSYVVSYALAQNLNEWAVIDNASKTVEDKVLATWNTYGLSGQYVLRVAASDTVGNKNELQIPLDIAERTDLIQYLEGEPRLFSPNNDGRRESTTIRLGLDDDVNLTMRVMSGTQVVRTITENRASGRGSTNFAWDGLDDMGSVVPDGTYLLHVSAASAANALLTQEEQITLTVDATDPVVELLRPSNGYVDKSGTLIGNISDLHLTSYRIELQNLQAGPAWQEIATGTTSRLDYPFGQLSQLDEGRYVVRFRAEDEAENQVDVSFDFVVDGTAPEVNLKPLEKAVLGSLNGPHGVSGSVIEENLASYALRYGAGTEPTAWANLAAGITLPLPNPITSWDVSTLPDGDYVLELLAVDKAGLEGRKTLPVVVDNTLPVVQITGPAEGDFITTATPILGSVTDDNFGSYQVEIAPGAKGASDRWSLLGKGESAVQGGGVWNWQALPPDGLYTLRVKAVDQAQNSAELLMEYRVDTVPPEIPTGLQADVVNGNEVQLSWHANTDADLAGYYVYRDGARITSSAVSAESFTDPAVIEGRHQYTISALDQAGWESERSAAVEIIVDLTPPAVKLTVPKDSAVVKGYLDIEGTAYAADDFKEYRLYVGEGINPSAWQLLRESPVATIADVLAQWNTVVLPEGAQYTIRLEAEDINGNLGQDRILAVIDNLPPAAPLGLSATPTGSDVALSWTANSENDLLGYLVFRDDHLVNVIGVAVGDLRPYAVSATVYDDSALPDGTYVYTIIAIDQAGNLSDLSAAVNVDIDTHAPHAVVVTPENAAEFDVSLYVLATTEDRDVAGVQFQYRAQGATTWVDLGSADTEAPFETYLDPPSLGINHGNYQIQAIATDTGGQTDPSPTSVDVVYKDLTRPAAALGLQTVSDGGSVTLTWDANTESDLAGYHIERTIVGGTSVRITVNPVSVTTYVDPGVADGEYEYRVVAIDDSDNEADPSEAAGARVFTPVLDQPYTPLSVLASDFHGSTDNDANLTAHAELVNGAGTTDLGAAAVDVNGEFSYAGVVLAGGFNTLRVTLTDDVGNRSKPAEVNVVSGQAPSIPSGVDASASGFDVAVTWQANPETNMVGYRVYHNGNPAQADEAASISSATASSSYTYTYPTDVVDGNISSYWAPLPSGGMPLAGQWLLLEFGAQRQVSGMQIKWNSLNRRAVDFKLQAWNADTSAWIDLAEVLDNPDQDNQIDFSAPYLTDRIRLVVERSNLPDYYYMPVQLSELVVLHQPLATVTQFNQTVTDGLHQYSVSAVNDLGFESGLSQPAEVATGDVIAPDPVTLSASVNGPDVTLDWTASVSPDVAHYLVYRDGALIFTQANLSSLQYIDTGLTNGTYEYTVTAVDLVGNESQPSNLAQATISGMVPATPLGLLVLVVPEGGALDLMWGPGTGGSATAYYEVRRSQTSGGPYTVVASTSSSNFRDSGLTDGTPYYYVIRAVDALNNHSGSSEEGGATPNDTKAPPVWLHYPAGVGTLYAAVEPSITVAGLSEPGATIRVTRNGFNVGSAMASLTTSESAITLWANSRVFLSPNGRYVAYRVESPSVVIHDLLLGTQIEIPVSDMYADTSIAWSADGQSLIFSDESTQSGGNYIRRYVLASRETIDLTNPADGNLNDAQLSPSGTQLAGFGARNGQYGLWLVDIDTGVWTLLVADDTWRFDRYSIRWSPDGSWLSYQRSSPTWTVELVHATSGTQQVVTSEAGASIPQWSPDGTELLFVEVGGGTPQVWHYVVSSGLTEAVTVNGQHMYPVWGPTGQRIAYYAADENNIWSITIRDMQTDVETQIDGATRSGGRYRLQWTQSGTLGLHMYGEYHTLVPTGYFELQGVSLTEGDNIFYAEAGDDSGNWSLPSDPITVNYDTAAFTDLAIKQPDVRILPQSPRVGDPVRVTAIVRNPSGQATPAGQLTIAVVDSAGTMTTLLDGRVIDPIPPAGSQAVSADWLVGANSGLYTMVVTIDAEDAIQEASEVNNTAFTDFLVSDGSGTAAQVALSIDRDVLNSNELLSVTANVTNGGEPFTGEVNLRIEDTNGYLVGTLLSEPVNALSYGASQQVDAGWNSGVTFAGDYVVHALLTDGAATIIHDATVPFRLLGNSELEASVATDALSYAPNTPVHVIGTYHYATGNSPMEGVTATVQLLDGQDQLLAEKSVSLGTLLPDNRGDVDLLWNTGTSPAGQYSARIEIKQGTFVLTQAQTALTVELGVAQLSGEISVTDAPIGLGTPQDVQYTVQNISNVLLAAQPLIVSLYEPDSQMILQSQRVTPSIPVAGAYNGTAQFATTALSLKDYTVMLQAEVLDNDGQIKPVTLHTAKFKVVDRSLPEVRIDAPIDGGFLSADAPLTVFASDDLTRIEKVEAMVDGGAWIILPVRDTAAGTWGELLTGLLDGAHTVMARATDGAGNVAETALVTFTLDTVTPVITVSGVEEWAHYNGDVTPIVTVTDVNAVTTLISLNGFAFESGAAISAEGIHTLAVNAEDAAGNITLYELEFEIDKTLPLVEVTAPTDGSIFSDPTTDVTGTTEPYAIVYLQTGTHQLSQLTAEDGAFLFTDIPLAMGNNTISLYAEDRAGNIGPTVDVTVTRQSEIQATLEGTIAPTGQVLIWYPAKFKGQSPDESDYHNDHGYGEDDDEDSASHGLCEELGVNRKHKRSIKVDDDWKSHHHEDLTANPLLEMVETTLQTAGTPYHIAVDEQDFITQLRTHSFSTVLFIDVMHMPIWKGESEWRYREQWPLNKRAQGELLGTIASGTGLLWIKTHPGHGHSLAQGLGMRIFGAAPHLSTVTLPDGPATVEGVWEAGGYGLSMRTKPGTAVGRLSPSGRPALMISRHGNGNVAIMAFNPALLTDQNAGTQILQRSLAFAKPIEVPTIPGGPVGIRWTTQQLIPPMNLEFVEELPLDMSFESALDGIVENDQLARWQGMVNDEQYYYDAIAVLPDVLGTYSVSGTLNELRDGLAWELVSATLDVTLDKQGDDIAVDLIDALNALELRRHDAHRRSAALWYIQLAIAKEPNSMKNIEYSIRKLLTAQKFIAGLDEIDPDIHRMFGRLLSVYQLAWIEQQALAGSDVTLNGEPCDMVWQISAAFAKGYENNFMRLN